MKKNKLNRSLLKVALLAFGVLTSAGSWGVTLDVNDSAEVSLKVVDGLYIMNLGDLNMGTFSLANTNGLNGAFTSFCVFRLGSSDLYRISVKAASTQHTSANKFFMDDATGKNTIDYDLFFDVGDSFILSDYSGATPLNVPNGAAGVDTAIPKEIKNPVMNGGSTPGVLSCDKNNAALFAIISNKNVASVPGDDYSDTITLTITTK